MLRCEYIKTLSSIERLLSTFIVFAILLGLVLVVPIEMEDVAELWEDYK